MKHMLKTIALGMCVGLFMATSLYAADVPSTSPGKPETGMTPGNIPATGDQDMAKLASETLRGKLIKSDGRMYTVEAGPGRQVEIRAGTDTKFENSYKGMEGDWIEALVTPDMHIKSIKKSTPGYIIEGPVLKVDGDSFVVKDTAGKEIRLQTDKDTKMIGTHKVGESIRAEYTSDGHVLSVKPVQITRGSGGG